MKEFNREINPVRLIGIVLLGLAVLSGTLGFINQHSEVYIPAPLISDYYANVSSELASIAITILLINYLSEQRFERRERARLIKELRSTDNAAVKRAANDLWVLDWLEDGCLRGAILHNSSMMNIDIRGADLRNADLTGADMRGSDLRQVKLDGAIINEANLKKAVISLNQLSTISSFESAIMPDGVQYNDEWSWKLADIRTKPFDPANDQPLYSLGDNLRAQSNTADQKDFSNSIIQLSIAERTVELQYKEIAWLICGVLIGVITMFLLKNRRS